MFNKLVKPSAILQQFIDYYFAVETDNAVDFEPMHRVYPTGKVVMVMHYGNPSLIKIHNQKSIIEPNMVLCGQQTSYYDLALAGKTGMVFIVFKALGACMFFEVPMNEVLNQNIKLNDIAGKEALELEDRFLCANGLNERINILETFLIKKLQESKHIIKPIVYTLNQNKLLKSENSIKQMADNACLSLKQFERKFTRLMGLKPKQYLRIQRFQNILQMKRNGFAGNLTELALENGYYDQAHFIHDFKQITGLSPKVFFNDQTLIST